MPFLASFSCLWCGAPHTLSRARRPRGLGAALPDCLGKAGDNGFLRFRLHQAITERGRAGSGTSAEAAATAGDAGDVRGRAAGRPRRRHPTPRPP